MKEKNGPLVYWGHLSIKLTSYRYRDPHVKEKTVSRPSNLKKGNTHPQERQSLFWDGALVAKVYRWSRILSMDYHKTTVTPLLSQWSYCSLVNIHLRLTCGDRVISQFSRSISLLLMPWLLALPGHYQPWYWPCRIARSVPYSRKDFNHLCHV